MSTAAEAPRVSSSSRTLDLALIGVFAALIAVLAMVPPIPVGSAGVPITLQTMGVALAGLVLGPWRGMGAAALYVVLGLIGLPIFAGFSGGIGVLAGPSAGYLLAFPFTAMLAGLLARLIVRRVRRAAWIPLLFLAGLAASIVFNHAMGIGGMMINLSLTWEQAFLADVVFWPGDVVKNIVAALAAVLLHRTYPDILVNRR